MISGERERVTVMKTDYNSMLSLYKRLLDITEKEQVEIADCNINRMEDCWSLKEDIIRELEKLSKGESWNSCREKSEEAGSLIRKIIAANKINIYKVRNMKEALLKDVSSLHNGKKAVSAYQACSR